MRIAVIEGAGDDALRAGRARAEEALARADESIAAVLAVGWKALDERHAKLVAFAGRARDEHDAWTRGPLGMAPPALLAEAWLQVWAGANQLVDDCAERLAADGRGDA